jgi:ATP-dependent helicase/nuclease subunit B
MTIQRLFFDWERPALDHAVAYLTREWQGGLLDLSRWTVIVPTRHAGRRLRERLAVLAAEQGTAVIPGRIVPPEFLFRPVEGARPLTDSLTSLLLWREVVASINPGDCPVLFPAERLLPDFTEQAALAAQLRDLRDMLCEEGFTFNAFARHYEGNPESDRWEDLCCLETRFLERVEQYGLRDSCMAKTESVQHPLPDLEPSQRLCVLFVPDPVPLAAQALQRLAEQRDITVCVHAPDSLQATFDDLGRPRADYWTTCRLPVADRDILLTQQPHKMLETITTHLAGLPPQQRIQCTIGMPDRTLISPLQELMMSRDIPPYDPAGTPAARGPLFRLIESLYNLLADDEYPALATLLRHPVFLDHLKQRIPELSSYAFLRDLDRLQNKHLPTDYAAFRAFAAQMKWGTPVIEVIDDIREKLAADPSEALPDILRGLFAGRTFKSSSDTDSQIMNTADILRQKLAALQDAPVLEQLPPREKMYLLVQELRKTRITTERTPEAVDLMGWLELHWEDAPQLLLCGMNDGMVPETIVGHPFLPDQACIENNLRDNTTRLARDAYLLHAITACRAPHQVVHLLSKESFTGDPQRPSRLLLMVPDEQLVSRVNLLFREASDAVPTPPRCHDWKLTPRDLDPWVPPKDIPVSAIKNYLASPMLFYFKNVLRMEPLDDRKEELDARDFGSLCHDVFEAFSKSTCAESTNPDDIYHVLLHEAESFFLKRYGTDLSVPLMLQKDALLMRLRAAARVQAEWRNQGWHIAREYSETSFILPLECGMTLKGRIDRIDRHDDGRLCIIDYKTSDKAADPAKTHLGKLQKDTPAHQAADDKQQWKEVQLPAYILMAAHQLKLDTARFACAYFNLPASVGETAISLWENIPPELLDSAQRCINTCARLIHQGAFSEPGKIAPYDEAFKDLLFNDPAAILDWPSTREEAPDA